MKLVYLPDSGLYLNPAHILYVRTTVNSDEFTIKFSGDHPNLIISLEDLKALTKIVDEF